MKFTNRLTKQDIYNSGRKRLKACPYPKDCMPVNYQVSKKNLGGSCSGIIHNANNLDCIRHCMFIEDLELGHEGELIIQENYMTPDEALQQARTLIHAAEAALNNSSEYHAHYLKLCEIVESGEPVITPSKNDNE